MDKQAEGKKVMAERNGVKDVEHGLRAAHRAAGSAVQARIPVRLRQVSPVIADRVTDPKRSVPRGPGKEKW